MNSKIHSEEHKTFKKKKKDVDEVTFKMLLLEVKKMKSLVIDWEKIFAKYT